MSRDHSIYVDHMLEAIANIELDTAGYDFEKFRRDRRVRQLVGTACPSVIESPNATIAARSPDDRGV